MNTHPISIVLSAWLACFAGSVLAQSPTIDGQLDAAFYGAPVSVQNTPTSYGNATNGHVRFAVGGSELDAAYARVADGYLYLFIAGNLETKGVGGLQWPAGNLNKLDIFVDSLPGGQGQGGDFGGLRGDNADVDIGAFGSALDSMGHLDAENDGLKFDAGFGADFYFTFNNYTEAIQWMSPPVVEAWRGILYYATLPTGGGGTAQTLGVARDSSHQNFTTTTTFTNGVKLGFNNSNTGGVRGTADANAADASLAASVATGLELAIPIQLLSAADGSINENIRLTAFVNSIDHTNMSNQVLGPMGQTFGFYGNLNDPRRCDFSADWSPGDQFFTVANPYPSARALLAPDFGADGTMTHHWLGFFGHAYVLEANTNLLSTNWVAVSGSVTSSLPAFSVVVTNTAPCRYYRSVRMD
jgi:hypothetical protein